MRTIKLTISLITLLFVVHSAAIAQNETLSEVFKKHFNETVSEVQKTNDAKEKRAILNDSFDSMLSVLEHIDSQANLSDDERMQLESYKNDIEEKKSELNGTKGFDEVMDEDLDDFSNYSQQYFEQATRYITISIGTAILIGLLLLLL